MGEDSNRQTHTTGDVYVHPRGKSYRDNYDAISWENPKEGCEGCNEDCECHGTKS